MTVIAWDGKTLAADKRVTVGSTTITTKKIERIYGMLLAGGAGSSAEISAMFGWLAKGSDPAAFPESQRNRDCPSILVIGPDGALMQYENTPYPISIGNKFWAIGSGAQFAIAAMHLGQTAPEAVELACLYDINCGNGIDTLEFE